MADKNKQSQKEKQILEATKTLIIQFGFDKTTVEEIAHEAGISKGAIYLVFASKQAILDRLVEVESLNVLEKITGKLDADVDGYTIFNVYRYSVLVLMENPLLAALYTRDRRVLGDYGARMMNSRVGQSGFSFGTEFIRHFQQAGMIDPEIDPAALGYIMMSLRYGMLTLDTSLQGDLSLESIGQLVGTMFQRAFGRSDGDDQAARAALKQLFEAGKQMLRQVSDMTADTTTL